MAIRKSTPDDTGQMLRQAPSAHGTNGSPPTWVTVAFRTIMIGLCGILALQVPYCKVGPEMVELLAVSFTCGSLAMWPELGWGVAQAVLRAIMVGVAVAVGHLGDQQKERRADNYDDR